MQEFQAVGREVVMMQERMKSHSRLFISVIQDRFACTCKDFWLLLSAKRSAAAWLPESKMMNVVLHG